MKNNKKGFTLIELLAVIVILAIIMVIAVPQILNVIQSSRDSAWKSNVKLIEEGIELGEATTTTGLTSSNFSISTVCTAASDTSIVDSLKSVADISSDDTEVTCAGAGSVKVTGKGQFANQPAATITCTNGNCATTFDGK